MSDLKLYVIFHGTFVFCKYMYKDNDKDRNKDRNRRVIDVFIPKVRTHVVRAGNWLGETELESFDPEGSAVYELKGVVPNPENVELPEKHNLVVGDDRHPANLRTLLHSHIVMPFPDAIITPRRSAVPKDQFRHKNESNPDPTIDEMLAKYSGNLGSVTVFTYRFVDLSDLRLVRVPAERGVHPWIPVPSGATPELPGGSVNLHFFSAHEVEEDLDEGSTAFDKMTEVFDGFPLGLRRTTINAELEVKELPAGVAAEECEDLNLRSQRMSKLGRMRKNGLDLNLLWHASE